MTADHQETRPRGRPPVGPDVKYRLPTDLRDQLAAAMRPGESEAATVRRLLTVALNPLLPAALRLAADDYETKASPDHALMTSVAAALNELAAAADMPGAAAKRATLLAIPGAEATITTTRARRPRPQSGGTT